MPPKFKWYTQTRVKKGTDEIVFKCTMCPLKVSTTDFNPANGNVRTQAARVMNEHAAKEHAKLGAMPPDNIKMR